MEIGTADIRLRGKHLVVLPRRVTPAEIMVLRMAHGDDCIESVTRVKGEKVDHTPEQERERLCGEYIKYVEGINRLFPGYKPEMPLKFEEVGVEIIDQKAVKKPAEEKPADRQPMPILTQTPAPTTEGKETA